MILLRPLEKLGLLYPINEALRVLSENAGDGKKFKDASLKVRFRFRLWTCGEWWFWWRWKACYIQLKHKFRMWQHKQNLLCRCVTHFQTTGQHKENCPKHRDFKKWWKEFKKYA